MLLLITVCGCVSVQSDTPKVPESTNLPEIKEAYETKTKLLHDNMELADIGTELDSLTTRIANQGVVVSLGAPSTVVASLMRSTRLLRESAKDILAKGPQYIEKLDNFSTTLQAAPATFINAAKLFRKFADEESYTDVAEDYRQVAVLFDHLATRTQKTGATLRERYNRDAMLETLKYIRHQERFLDRFEAALEAQMSDRDMEAFLQKIETYAKQFELLRKQIRQLNTAFRNLDDQPTPPKLSAPTPPALLPSQNETVVPADFQPPASPAPAKSPDVVQPPQTTSRTRLAPFHH